MLVRAAVQMAARDYGFTSADSDGNTRPAARVASGSRGLSAAPDPMPSLPASCSASAPSSLPAVPMGFDYGFSAEAAQPAAWSAVQASKAPVASVALGGPAPGTAAASGSSRGEKRRRVAATGPLKQVSAPAEAVILPPESVEELVPLYPSAKLLGKCKPLAEELFLGPKITDGVVHGVALRFTRVSKSFECDGRWQNFEGTVVSYREPFFRVQYDDGDTEDQEGKELEKIVIMAGSSTPLEVARCFEFDMDVFSWLYVREFQEQLRGAVAEAGVVLPPSWLAPGSDLTVVVPAAPSSSLRDSDFQAAETHWQDALLGAALEGQSAESTHDNYRLPFLKFFVWYTAREYKAWPPEQVAVGRYTAALAEVRQNAHAPSVAVTAINYVSQLNSWGVDFSSGVSGAPSRAAKRSFRHPTRKVQGLEPWMVLYILQIYVFAEQRLGSQDWLDWSLTVGICIGVG